MSKSCVIPAFPIRQRPSQPRDVYGHVIDELADAPRVPAGVLIQQARDAAAFNTTEGKAI